MAQAEYVAEYDSKREMYDSKREMQPHDTCRDILIIGWDVWRNILRKDRLVYHKRCEPDGAGEIKKLRALKPTFTIELANGYNGYLPTPEQHALGGYETWRAKSSYLAVDAEPKVRQTLLKILDEVAR